MSRMVLYTAPNACSIAPYIVLAESGLDFEVRVLDLVGGEQRG